jgi:hypothetical protein
MGNQQSNHVNTVDGGKMSETSQIFHKELEGIHTIVNAIVNDKNVFRNSEYNFLSKDVCSKNYMVLESDLKKHLKVELTSAGQTLYLIPKDSDSKYNKYEICQKIANHYIKILYILSLVKNVYNLEKYGEKSISGIIMRNVTVVDDLLQITFCAVPHKDYSKDISKAEYLDFSQLEGLAFFHSYFLDDDESKTYIDLMRRVLGHYTKSSIQKYLCESTHIASSKKQSDIVQTFQLLFETRYGEKLTCPSHLMSSISSKTGGKDISVTGVSVLKGLNGVKGKGPRRPNLLMKVAPNNPVLSSQYCNEKRKYLIQTNTVHGKKVLAQYHKMKANYKKNLDSIESILHELVIRQKDNSYVLRDLDKRTLDHLIVRVKETVKRYYIQSLFDYHVLLEMGKNTQNINM